MRSEVAQDDPALRVQLTDRTSLYFSAQPHGEALL